jgi:hypothetical protein
MPFHTAEAAAKKGDWVHSRFLRIGLCFLQLRLVRRNDFSRPSSCLADGHYFVARVGQSGPAREGVKWLMIRLGEIDIAVLDDA